LWLIDPYDITIQNSGAPLTYSVDQDPGPTPPFDSTYTSTANSATIDVAVIETALGAGDVEIITDDLGGGGQAGNIIFDATLDYADIGTNKTLTLNADGGITFEASSSITDENNSPDSLNINLYANGDILLNSGVNIKTNGGNFTVGFVDQSTPANNIIPTSFTNNGTISTAGRTG
ncbi:MAG: hypothetical protein GY943_20495, partial [Chloroflexi bacterium]|nr:hypothetical protein [Chloroflexota bacterium]